MDVLYIAGSGRSGSTLIERVLGQNRAFAPVGELRYLWLKNFDGSELCGCGAPLNECPFWLDVFHEAFGGLDRVDFDRMRWLRTAVDRLRYVPRMYSPLPDEIYENTLREYGEVLHGLYSAVGTVTGCRIVIDSSKDTSFLFLLSRIPEIRLHVLHLVRDSRAVAFSWTREKIRPEFVRTRQLMRRDPPIRSAGDWVFRNLSTELLRKRVTSYNRIRYEDFVSYPLRTARELALSLGIPPEEFEFLREREVALEATHSVAGNPLRFNRGPTRIALDVEWMNKMKGFDKIVTTLATWPLLLRYGYAVDTA